MPRIQLPKLFASRTGLQQLRVLAFGMYIGQFRRFLGTRTRLREYVLLCSKLLLPFALLRLNKYDTQSASTQFHSGPVCTGSAKAALLANPTLNVRHGIACNACSMESRKRRNANLRIAWVSSGVYVPRA